MIDLHIHSRCSDDGEFTPAQLVDMAAQNAQTSHIRLEKTRELGFSQVTEADLEKLSQGSYWQNCWFGEMFAEVLLHMPQYEQHPLLKPNRPGGARSDNPYVNFYWDFYSQGKPC